jgi:hypothetical protein
MIPAPALTPRPCLRCGQPIVGRSSRAVYCSRVCKGTAAMRRFRQRRRLEAQFARPRCMICDAPLPYGSTGHNLSARTCSRACAVKRWNWFGRVQTGKAA